MLVFYSDAHAWQFRIISDGAVFGEQKLYYSAEAAEQAEREGLKTESSNANVSLMKAIAYPVKR